MSGGGIARPRKEYLAMSDPIEGGLYIDENDFYINGNGEYVDKDGKKVDKPVKANAPKPDSRPAKPAVLPTAKPTEK
jgi:hypothetical protein